ncbi:MAG TPA: SBBP repeat-containing protein, partial [Verrucomicrobiae bacterium]|nr:SBBP repeat-containing protein [Verrucomicrobiae bacterium]
MKTNSISAGRGVHARTIANLIFRRPWLWTGFLAFAAIAFGPEPAHAAVTEAWVQRSGSESLTEDRAYKVVTDATGNVIVAGSTDSQAGSGSHMLVIKYSGAGVSLWTNRCIGSATATAVDGSGNVFVTGSSGYDYATIAYSSAGVPLWTNRYHGPGNWWDEAKAVAVDSSGNVFVTGISVGGRGEYDYATIAYSGAGVALWTNRYTGPFNGYNEARAAAVDSNGNVFVTGTSYGSGGNEDYATVAYSGAGVPLWTNRFNGPANLTDQANAVAVGGNGNVFVTGTSYGSGLNLDFVTIAYSGAGVPLWTNRYNGTGNGFDGAAAVAVGASGNVFVTGTSVGSGGEYDYVTIAYSGPGVPLWTNRYNGPANGYDNASAVAVDGNGNVFVTGYSGDSRGIYNYATIGYSVAGVALWTNRYHGPGNGYSVAHAAAVDGSGNVFVTGESVGSDGRSDYVTIAYSGAGVSLWTNRYAQYAWEIASAVAVDGSGNVFVTGSSTIKYSSGGVPLWTNGVSGTAIAVDGSGNVFVMESSATIAYSGAGASLWTNYYNLGAAIAVDASGNVFVT